MWSFKNTALACFLLALSACGFQPLYAGKGEQGVLAGDEMSGSLSTVFINTIPGVYGQMLRSRLTDMMTPKGNPEKPLFRLAVSLPEPSVTELGIQMDNFATRLTLTYNATYELTTYPAGKIIMSDIASATGSYNIIVSPYATEVAERALKKRLIDILGNDISMRIAVYLRDHPDLIRAEAEK